MTRRWYSVPLALAALGLLGAGCSSSSPGGTPDVAGSTGTHSSAPANTPTPGTSTQPAQTATTDSLLRISKLCLVSMTDVQALSPTIYNLAPKPVDQPSTSGVDSCQYGGTTTASGLLTKFLSITVLANWSGMPNHFTSPSGFANASAGVVSVNGTSLVIAGAQITSGSQNGSWLTLTVGNYGHALVTWQALEKTLGKAETQYVSSSSATVQPSSPPTATTGGNSSAATDAACKLISTSVISSTFPPPDSNGLTAIETGHGPLKSQVADAMDYVCGYDFWANNAPSATGSPDGSVLVTLSCGPGAGQDATLTDDVSSPVFVSGGMNASVGVTRYGGSVGTGSQTVQQVLANAASVAKRTNACG